MGCKGLPGLGLQHATPEPNAGVGWKGEVSILASLGVPWLR